jgi:large subunit ribosomal protein L34
LYSSRKKSIKILTGKRVVLKFLPMKKSLTTPTILKRKRTHGFRKRKATPSGRRILRMRRKKGRTQLVV